MSRILIIEDEEAIADLEKDYLELSDFTVEIASDGIEGEKKALSEDYDLIVLDLMLPGKDGFEVCRSIRDKKNVPILMVSAKKDDIDKIRGLGLGADDYMTKPFSPSELVARVKAHLARYERPRDVYGLTVKKSSSPERNSTFLLSLRRTPTTYIQKTSFSERSGIWNPSVILPP